MGHAPVSMWATQIELSSFCWAEVPSVREWTRKYWVPDVKFPNKNIMEEKKPIHWS